MKKFIFVLILCLIPCFAYAINLPAPPSIGGVGKTADIWQYTKTSIVTIAGVILALLFVYFVFSGGGGLLQSLKQARERGEWGGFFTYLVSMIVVAIIILFLVYFANNQFLRLI